jgi:putative ABC transport system permease protein
VAHAAPGVSPETARDAVAALPGWDVAVIRTGEQQTRADTRELTQDVDVMAAGLLAFAAVALFVAGLVITNTFQVLVAQRTRMLALLRCTGATRRQIRRSVLFEAAVLGSATSLAGLVTATALVNAAAAVLSRRDLQVDVPGAVAPSPASVLVPLVLGVLVTVLAALSPARAAARVSPVAALRPAPTSSLRARAGVVRLVLVLLMVTAGAALLALGVVMTSRSKDAGGLLPALAGGALAFLGVLVGGSVFLPRLVGLTGRLAGRWGGVPTRIATANAVRNPRRTATTSAALLIGVTLVATMTTGAAVLTTTLARELDTRLPVDVMVGFEPYRPAVEAAPPATPVPAAVAPAAAGVEGVAESALLNGGQVRLSGWSGKPRTATTASDPEHDADPGSDADPIVGIGLGVVFGWAGAASVIGGVYHPALVLPVGELALLLAGGVLAGLVASALPGRRAARTPPVAALAE